MGLCSLPPLSSLPGFHPDPRGDMSQETRGGQHISGTFKLGGQRRKGFEALPFKWLSPPERNLFQRNLPMPG